MMVLKKFKVLRGYRDDNKIWKAEGILENGSTPFSLVQILKVMGKCWESAG